MPKPNWATAMKQCENYRNYMSTLDVPEEAKKKAYLITKEDIDALLSQDGKSLDGIRVYIGEENFPDGEKLIRLISVAVEKTIENGVIKYNDYNVPGPDYVGDENDEDDDEGMGDMRPCPDICSDADGLNTDPPPPPIL